MKYPLFFLAALLVGTTAAHAQKISLTQVPATVKAAFAARFPTVKTATWEKNTQQIKQAYDYETHNDFWARDAFLTQDVYEADFKLNGQKMSVVITPSGLVQETEVVLNDRQLPPAVRATLTRDFNACQVQEIATVTKADGSTLYEAELAQAGQKQEILFTADGQQILP
jgi:hypothetical protein